MTRRELRENIFKIIFQLPFSDDFSIDEQAAFSLEEIKAEASPEYEASDRLYAVRTGKLSDEDAAYINNKAALVAGRIDEIDRMLSDASHSWNINRIGKAELAILRLAVYEMKYDDDIPAPVAMNEAIELAKEYCDEKAAPFINGVLSAFVD